MKTFYNNIYPLLFFTLFLFLSPPSGLAQECVNPGFAGQISENQVVCTGFPDPRPIHNIKLPIGGRGDYEYLWMFSEMQADGSYGPFKPIPGATGVSYDPGPVTVNTYFVRCVRTENCEDYVESNRALITYAGDDDCIDLCPDDPYKRFPGSCGCGVEDIDTDQDGTADCDDQCPNDPNKTSPGACGCNIPDTDSDGDGTADCADECPDNPNKSVAGLCGCEGDEADSDNDGYPNCYDECPNDPNKIAPGNCGCGEEDLDTDRDGVLDCDDLCPNDPNKTAPGDCGCGEEDLDKDQDGTPDCEDLCPNDPNKVAPGDCGCGVADIDSDGDGTLDCNDDCPNDPNKTNPGDCGCGIADIDSDGDGTLDCNDDCPNDPNKTNPGDCGCGVADIDSDGDGTLDCNDDCDNSIDSDGDGTADCDDDCPNDPNKVAPGDCGCGIPDIDSDGDGTLDCDDDCPNDPNKVAPGDCGCGVADIDSDQDGTPDCDDECPNDPNKIAPGDCGCGVAEDACGVVCPDLGPTGGPTATVGAVFDGPFGGVACSTKDISNVTIDICPAGYGPEDTRDDNLSGYSHPFSASGQIAGVWVKSGNNQSGECDNNGCGEYIPNPNVDCQVDFTGDRDELLLYPNPGRGVVYLDTRAYAGEGATIQVFSTTGQQVLQKKADQLSLSVQELDMSTQRAGTYYVKIYLPKQKKYMYKYFVLLQD